MTKLSFTISKHYEGELRVFNKKSIWSPYTSNKRKKMFEFNKTCLFYLSMIPTFYILDFIDTSVKLSLGTQWTFKNINKETNKMHISI